MKYGIIALLLAALGLGLFLWKRQAAPVLTHRLVTVERGELIWVQRETGLIAPHHPRLVVAPMTGTLEWMIEDGAWVEAGDRLFVVDDEEALRTATEQRSTLLGLEQELAIARLKRQHAARLEQLKVDAAARALTLARLRLRILSATPEGGNRLVRLHRELLPLEAEAETERRAWQAAQDGFQQAEDAFLAASTVWQEAMDGIARTLATLDEERLREQGVDPAKAEERKAATVRRTAAEATLAQQRQGLPALVTTRDAARTERDRLRPPRDAAAAALAKREAAMQELFVQVEIEKRGLEAARLELDEAAAVLTKDDADKSLADAEAGLIAGAVSAAERDRAAQAVQTAKLDLEIVQKRLAIARRPVPEEQLTEARMAVEQAEEKGRSAGERRDRALAQQDAEIAALQARIARARFDLSRVASFPAVLESDLALLEHEREGLGPEDTERRTALDAEMAQTRKHLEEAKARPPDIVLAPIAGAVRLVPDRWGDVLHAGSKVEQEMVVVEIQPAENLEVRLAINQTRARLVVPGQKAEVEIPALGCRLQATVGTVSGLGRDPLPGQDSAKSGITAFEARLALAKVPAALRPGMTALVGISLDRVPDAVWLPRSALAGLTQVSTTPASWQARVLVPGPEHPVARTITGTPFAEDRFIIGEGLKAGDTVLVEGRP